MPKKKTFCVDLLILDIDNTFLYHRTVAVANWLFVKTTCDLFRTDYPDNKIIRTKDAIRMSKRIIFSNISCFNPRPILIKRIFLLKLGGLLLHLLNLIKCVAEAFGFTMSNRILIWLWTRLVKGLRIYRDEYYIGKDSIQDSLYKDTMSKFEKARKHAKKVVGISQSFTLDNMPDPVAHLLGLDEYISNVFVSDENGIISGAKVDVFSGESKKRVALSLIKKYSAKKIGLFITEKEDRDLLKLSNISIVYYKRGIGRSVRRFKHKVKL